MEKAKEWFWYLWDRALDAVDYAASWIAAYPKASLALMVTLAVL